MNPRLPHRSRRRSRSRALVAGLILSVPLGCGPSVDDPLPPKDDLYVYSLAVATKAALRVGETPRSRYHFGLVHERFGIEEEALLAFREAVERDPGLAIAYRKIGFLLSQRKNQMNEAVAAYEQALRVAPRMGGIRTRIGLILLHQDRALDAVRIFEEEERNESANPETFYSLGQAYGSLGDHEKAVSAYRKAIAEDSAMRSAHYGLARSLRVLGRTEEAEKAMTEFRSIKDEDYRAVSEAPAVKDDRPTRLRAAAATWRDAADLFLGEAGATRDAALAGEFTRHAHAALREALALDESDPEVWEMLSAMLHRDRRLTDALAVTTRAAEKLPDDGTWPYRSALLELELARAGDDAPRRVQSALDLLLEAVRRSPNFHEAHFQIARVLFFDLPNDGRVNLALEHAERAVKISPEEKYFDVLALAYVRTRRPDLAEKTLADGVARHPASEMLKFRLAEFRRRYGGGTR